MSLDWPFYEQRHRDLAAKLGDWASANLGLHHGEDIDAECRKLVRDLGAAGFLELCTGTDTIPDVRSLAIARETLAYHSGLADFAFAMQGLGSGAISLAGHHLWQPFGLLRLTAEQPDCARAEPLHGEGEIGEARLVG